MENHPVTLLIVDDDAEIRELLAAYLGARGFEVRTLPDGRELTRTVRESRPAAVVLDLMLPGEDGFSLCRALRAAGETVPVIMLTAKGDEIDRIVGLELGADDYLPKPFNPRELLARIQAVLRRGKTLKPADRPRGEVIRFGLFALDLGARTLSRDGGPIVLTTGEYNLLAALATHPHRPLDRNQIIELGFHPGQTSGVSGLDRAIDVHISRLRKKLEAQAGDARHIDTVRGLGYVFLPEGKPQ